MTVTIIGAGIGGLTTAIALQQKNINFEIFESFSSFKPIGAGIMLANNAMQVYNQLGLYDSIAKESSSLFSLNITTKKLKTIFSSPTASPQNNLQSFAIHRAKLQQILLQQIPTKKIHLGKKLSHIQQETPNNYSLQFNDNTTHQTNIILGADGINSVVRDNITNSQLRDAQQLCWRGIADFSLPQEFKGELYEVWDKQQRFGFVQINPKQIYWYALTDKINYTLQNFYSLFASYPPIIKNILANTNRNKIIESPLFDLSPIKQWYKDNICLLGDAAHATTPNMGQGACQSIEDALVFADCMSKNNNPQKAFQSYQSRRKAKALQIVNTSWKIGKLSHWSNHASVFLRNLLLRNTPTFITKQQQQFINTLN